MTRGMLGALIDTVQTGVVALMGLPGGRPGIAVALTGILLALSCALSGPSLGILTALLINLLMAMSVSLLLGLAGQVPLGQAGFLGLGAYASALLTEDVGLPFPVAVALATLVAGTAGFLLSLPAGRLHVAAMAVITLGFGLIARELAGDIARLTPSGYLSVLPSPALNTLALHGRAIGPLAYFQFVLVVTAFTAFGLDGLSRTCLGRALAAIRNDDATAGALGISHTAMMRLAYTLSGALAGLGGAFQAYLVGGVSPAAFDLSRSVQALAIVLVGGVGSMFGQLISAAAFTVLPETLQGFIPYGVPGELVVCGAVLALGLTVAPRGIGGWFPPARFIDARALRIARSRHAKPIPRISSRVTTAGLIAAGITVRFGALTAVNEVSMTLQPGRITALIGPNGAGKSSLLDALTGFNDPAGGNARFFGRTINRRPANRIAGHGLRRSFQIPRPVTHFTVRENLLLGAHRRLLHNALFAALGVPFAIHEEAAILAQVNAMMDLAGLADLADRIIDSLPHGPRRLTEIALQMMSSPRMLLLDEPSAGLDDPELLALVRLIRTAKQAGIALVLIEPYLDFVAALVDDVLVMDRGQIIFNGEVAGMRANKGLIAAYGGPAMAPSTSSG